MVLRLLIQRTRVRREQVILEKITVGAAASRKASTSTAIRARRSNESELSASLPTTVERDQSGLSRLPTLQLLRNILLGTFFSSPLLWKPGFVLLKRVANSRSRFVNADNNRLLRAIVKPLLYDQFCAGTTPKEISRTRDAIKRVGYSGIILCYGKELQVAQGDRCPPKEPATAKTDADIRHWKEGNLETLDIVESGDWVGIKFTGAGPRVTEALMCGECPPPEFISATDAICQKASARNCRIWIDAEQQVLQTAIDRWTIDLMRKYNVQGRVLVYNTLQAYLKKARSKLTDQLALADNEGWSLAIKLVRGAYIGNDRRELIHDTKQDTDDSYNAIVHDLLSGSNLGFAEADFPTNVQLFLAGHNPQSIAIALGLIQTLNAQKRLKILPDFGQLQGMGDVLGCNFLQHCEDLQKENSRDTSIITPKIYKCLTWGSIQECMQYLVRRAVENSGGTDRMRDGLSLYLGELRRRILRQ